MPAYLLWLAADLLEMTWVTEASELGVVRLMAEGLVTGSCSVKLLARQVFVTSLQALFAYSVFDWMVLRHEADQLTEFWVSLLLLVPLDEAAHHHEAAL
jgi:hypothetical protein